MQFKNKSKIFKAYDIRGLYPEEINEELASKIIKAFYKLFKPKSIVIGYDVRNSSKSLYKAIKKSLLNFNITIYDIGLTTTPLFYFANGKLKADAGIMITASHNPSRYNGLKLCYKLNAIGYKQGLNKVEKIFLEEKSREKQKTKKAEIKKINIINKYKQHIKKYLNSLKKLNKKYSIVVDASNGFAGIAINKIFQNNKIKIHKLFFKPDGNFPGHGPDPTKEKNREKIKQEIKKTKASFGLILDADADRAFFIDEKARDVMPEIIAALFIEKLKIKTIVAEITTSRILYEIAKERKIKIIRSKVGHTHIQQLMKKYNADLAIESSGHIYFRENYYFEDPIIALIKLILILDKEKKDLSELIKKYQKYYKKRVDIKFKGNFKELEEIIKKNFEGKISKVDGLTLTSKEFWFNIRKSHTEPLVRITIETKNKEIFNKVLQKIKTLVS